MTAIEPKKPKWVEALEAAEATLRDAANCSDSADQHALNLLAQSWIWIAAEYRNQTET